MKQKLEGTICSPEGRNVTSGRAGSNTPVKIQKRKFRSRKSRKKKQVKIRKKQKIRKMPKYKLIVLKFIIIIEIRVDQNSEKIIIIT